LTKTIDSQSSNRFITPRHGIFDQPYFEKGCVTTVAPVDHAENDIFVQVFFEKGLEVKNNGNQ